MASNAELHFETLWEKQWPTLDLYREHCINAYVLDWRKRYAENRRAKYYRSDFVSEEAKVIIEIEGHGHRQWNRYQTDLLKYNLAAYAGYVLVRLQPDMVTKDEVDRIGRLIIERRQQAMAVIEELKFRA